MKRNKTADKFLGKTFTSNNYGDFEVIDYISCGNVTVVFKNTGVELKTNTTCIVSGNIKDPSVTKFVGDRSSTKRCKHLGNIYTSNNYGDYGVVEALDDNKVRINFLNTGNTEVIHRCQIMSGKLRDSSLDVVCKSRSNNIIHNVGDKGKDKSLIKKNFKTYQVWCSVLQRCYSPSNERMRSGYKDCTVSDMFKMFPLFLCWWKENVVDDKTSYQLDKDILVKGNRIYGEDTCCLVPREINNLFINTKNTNKTLPVGVRFVEGTNMFKSVVRKFGKSTCLGSYTTVEKAFNAYKKAKEAHVKDVANKWKDKIDPRAYEALMNWTINIDD